ncbi:tissue alpha-L-fucosidase isoform X2 [Hydra vulgaris]|uniref:alpha-L-fucosidase n=1 Tax=Hydra vulgaris TaxID=6087 RepID=A0ABM4C9Q6_HYDVU
MNPFTILLLPSSLAIKIMLLLLMVNCELGSNVVNENSDVVSADERNKIGRHSRKFEPHWQSLDQRKLPKWYDDAKFGIFIHWGIYSVTAFKSEWFWWHWKGENKREYNAYMRNNFPSQSYQDLASKLTGSSFNANEWAELVEDSGAKYFVFTSKHHEGFTHWKSDESWNWNSVDLGPKRDVLDELKTAFSNTNVTFGLYYSLYEWFNPWYNEDKKNDFKTQEFVKRKIMPQLYDLVHKYEPLYIWSDGDWEAKSDYWNSAKFLAWLYNESPVKDNVVVNDRWGKDANCIHGDIKTCKDRYNPGKKLPFKWENAMTIDKLSWGYRQEAKLDSYISTSKLIENLIETVSCGGNLLLNVAPTADGRITPIYEERLRDIGKWLRINGEAIYGTKPWRVQKDPHSWKVWYTQKLNSVYAIMCGWPKSRYLHLGSPETNSLTSVKLLGFSGNISWSQLSQGIQIDLYQIPRASSSGDHAWTFVLENIE